MEETLFLARDSAGQGRIRFVTELAALPPAEVDRGQIKQVLLNVLVNAAQAISGNGTITITTAADGNEVSVRVRDDGCGIPAEVRERIFDPFFSTKPTGTGLGMAVARRIIEDHKGRIIVASAEGEGTSITLILPCLPDEANP